MSLLITLGLAIALIQSPVAPQTAACSGRVLEDGSRAPIAGAEVLLLPSFPHRPRTAITDRNGRYEFERLEAGRYRINVQKAGFSPLIFPGVPIESPQVDLKAGERREGVDVTLQRGVVIVGRVLDDAGEPLVHAQVLPMRKPSVPPGAMFQPDQLMPIGPAAQTNDLGEFRLFGLPPGEYYVQAAPRPYSGRSAAPRATTMRPTYFPGTSDPGAAQPIGLVAGQTSADVEIRMMAVSAFYLSGVVRDEAGRPVSNAMVRLVGERSNGPRLFMLGPSHDSRTDTSGAFTIGDVTNGTYTLLAVAPVVISGPPGAQSRGPSSRRGSDVAATGGGGFMSFGTVAGTMGGGVTTEMSNGTTIEYRDDTATRVPITINEANVSGLEVIVRRPAR